jgi:hypothetical protein
VLCDLTLDMLALFYIIIILVQRVVLTFCTYLCYFQVFCFTAAFSKANADHKG